MSHEIPVDDDMTNINTNSHRPKAQGISIPPNILLRVMASGLERPQEDLFLADAVLVVRHKWLPVLRLFSKRQDRGAPKERECARSGGNNISLHNLCAPKRVPRFPLLFLAKPLLAINESDAPGVAYLQHNAHVYTHLPFNHPLRGDHRVTFGVLIPFTQ
ncbi:hypothetical protein F4774DRAFT_414407 [Daldinia eschscholtzii]|nr:hypothetical protein F4774DRAFT_414407 [Daldinia eschscholtzii]